MSFSQSRPKQELTLLNQLLYIFFIGSGELHSSVPLQRMVDFSCDQWWLKWSILENSCCCVCTFRNFKTPSPHIGGGHFKVQAWGTQHQNCTKVTRGCQVLHFINQLGNQRLKPNNASSPITVCCWAYPYGWFIIMAPAWLTNGVSLLLGLPPLVDTSLCFHQQIPNMASQVLRYYFPLNQMGG